MSYYLLLPGGAGRYASTPDAAWQDITDDLDIRVDVQMTDWTPAVDMSFAAKWGGGVNQYQFGIVGTTGVLRFTLGGLVDCQSTVATGFVDGTKHQIRVVRNRGVTAGYATDSVSFFTRASGTDLSDDTGWSILGVSVGDGGVAMNTGGTGVFTIGTSPGEPALLIGHVYDVWMSNVIDGTAIMSFDADDFTLGDTDTDTAVDGEGNTWTINGAGSVITDHSIAVTGTAVTGGVLESEIVTGGQTIILTVTGDTWVATAGDDNAITTALIAGIDSGGAEAAGWDAVVKAHMTHAEIVRTSATVLTITLAAEATYAITANETITITIPYTALTAAGAVVATPTFAVTNETPASSAASRLLLGVG